MNKYQYYVNNNPVPKKEMMERLRKHCYKVVDRQQVGMIGVDFAEFDEKMFNKELRRICGGKYCAVIIGHDVFSRKRL